MQDYRAMMTDQITRSIEGSAIEFRAVPKPQMNKRIASEEGMEFPAIDLDYLSSPDITLEDIRDASKVAIVSASMRKLEKLIFEGAELQVSAPDDVDVSEEEVQEIQTKVEEADKIIRTTLRMRQAWYDRQQYGSAVFEKIPGKAGDLKAYQVFKRLPAYSFSETPGSRAGSDQYIAGDLLLGIIFDTTKSEFEYWQKQSSSGQPILIDPKNILHVRRETSDSPDGESVLISVLPLIKKLAFIEKALMQRVNREGAPGLDVVVKEFRDQPMPASSEVWGFKKRFDEGKKIAKNHGKDTVICHPDSIEISGIDYKNTFDIKGIVSYYESRILDALIPKNFTDSDKAGSLSSNAANLDVLTLYVRGEQHEIEEPFLKLWHEILTANGLDGWKVEIVWRDLNPVAESEKFKQLEIAVKAGIFTEDELREMVGYPAKPEEEIEEAAAPESIPEETPATSEPEEIPTSEEAVVEKNSAVEDITNEKIVGLLRQKPTKLMEVLAEHGVKPWELPFDG